MKNLNITFTDEEFKELEKEKEKRSRYEVKSGGKKLSWEKFILLNCS